MHGQWSEPAEAPPVRHDVGTRELVSVRRNDRAARIGHEATADHIAIIHEGFRAHAQMCGEGKAKDTVCFGHIASGHWPNRNVGGRLLNGMRSHLKRAWAHFI